MPLVARESSLFISGPAGLIEAVITYPDNAIKKTIGIICHPHPLYGGSMMNKVVTTVARTFTELGVLALRFNFRGVGKSAGSYDQGNGEFDDLMAVLHWVKQEFADYAIWLAGFSFGAYIAAKAAVNFPVTQLITIAPPVHHFDFKHLGIIYCPWILVQGDADEVVPPEQVYAWVNELKQPPQLIRLAGASHFFHGRLIELRDLLKEALIKTITLSQ